MYPFVRMFAVAFTNAVVAFPTRSPKMLVAMTSPLVRTLAVALTNAAVAFPTRSPKRFDAVTLPDVRMLAVALTKVDVAFPTTSPRNAGAITTPVDVRFPTTSPVAVGALEETEATTVAPCVLPTMSTFAVGGYAMFETALIPVRNAPFPTKNDADALPTATTFPAPMYAADTFPMNHGAYTFPTNEISFVGAPVYGDLLNKKTSENCGI